MDEETSNLALDIVNKFTEFSYEKEGKPCPIDVMPENRVWLTKLCALAERCAAAENNLDLIKDYAQKQNVRIIELEKDVSRRRSELTAANEDAARLYNVLARIGNEENPLDVGIFCEDMDLAIQGHRKRIDKLAKKGVKHA